MENESIPDGAGAPVAEQHALAALRNFIAQRQFADAIHAADALVLQHPANREALFLLGVAQAEQREYSAAGRNIAAALEGNPHASWTWTLVLVNVLRDAGELPPAG